MQRQTRRLTTTAESADVSQMDPWKDDRCRDFIALNTIQRLRAYHADEMPPVEPVNVVRATNLLLLPAAQPDKRTCEEAEGCAVDLARILFFGPTAFVSLTAQGRMTASPHGRHHSGSRASFTPTPTPTKTTTTTTTILTAKEEVEEETGEKTGVVVPVKSAAPQTSLEPITLHKEMSTEKDTATVHGSISHERNTKEVEEELPHDVVMPDATPLKRPEMDTAVTPAPRLPEPMGQPIITATTSCEEEQEKEKGEVGQVTSGNNSNNNNNNNSNSGNEVVRFSCAIVEAIVAYYQSLLSRGVVLDRFNAKDLAFSWWVVGRNMDVAALHQHSGPMRRDALLILVRHFYYELLTEQRPKKSLHLDSPTSLRGVKEEGSSNVKGEEGHGQEKSSHSREHKEKEKEKEKERDHHHHHHQHQQQHQQQSVAGEEVKKRPRSRLDPTRTSPPPVSSRIRRRSRSAVDDEMEEKKTEKQTVKQTESVGTPILSNTRTRQQQQQSQSQQSQSQQQQAKRTQKPKETVATKGVVATQESSSTKTTTTTTTATTTTTSMNNNNNSGINTTTTSVTTHTVTTSTTAGTTKTENKDLSSTTVNVDPVPLVEKPHRSTRSAIIEEVWRPIRSTRRRLLPSEDSADFIEAKSTTADRRNEPSLSLKLVMERIERRMANDPIYASLLTAFPSSSSSSSGTTERMTIKKETDHHENDNNESDEKSGPMYGIYPALMQLYRYQHVESDKTVTMLSRRLEGKNGENEDEIRREVRNQTLGSKKRKREHTDEEEHEVEEKEEVEEREQQHQEQEEKEEKIQSSEIETLDGHSHNISPSLDVLVKTEQEEAKISLGLVENVHHVSYVNDEGNSSPIRIPSSFSDLTYAQRCLLTWETSVMLFPRSSVPSRKRQSNANKEKNEVVKPITGRKRRVYDYWKTL
ncbi:uncharacterized protein TM35_000021600 [Trypanosoma theileri]|uniref:Uncharacterized protein n=1 Tax=Trypanosoma theileri TaxID=67003 RepID=A0A1X0P7C4_9TRYP|nr:uncharacterized protein TM35_000021600 [Trypanosoma theileri]ORC92834.1 hypothetical protein TM35_000021600 [Trypanosoma theileri]